MDYILDKEKPRDAINALSNLPISIPEAYEEVLVRIKKTKGQDTALHVLSWLFYARRSLTMEEIQEVLSIQIQPRDTDLYPQYFMDPFQIIHSCQGLVELDHISRIIRFTHYTVQEYLKDKFLDKLLAPTELAKVCLTYLTFDIFKHGPCENEEAFHQRKIAYKFTDYAVRYWGLYVRGKGEKDPVITDILLDLFKSSNKCNAIRQHQVWINTWTFQKWSALTPLHIIAQEGLITFYNQFISSPHKNISDPRVREHSSKGISKASWNKFREYLKLGALDGRNDDYKTPLHIAAIEGHVAMISSFLQAGASICAVEKSGRTALHLATKEGRGDVVKVLLKNGAEIGTKDKTGVTALYLAMANGHKGLVELLLNNGAEFEFMDEHRLTALHVAAESGHKNVVELLLNEGLEIGAIDREGRTALHLAAKEGQKDVVALLLNKGTEVAAIDREGKTALHHTVEQGYSWHRGDRKGVIELLLSKGLEIGVTDGEGRTAVHLAAEKGHKEMIEFLLSKGVEMAAIDKTGKTALHLAAAGDGFCYREAPEVVVELLLSKGFEIGATDRKGRTALHLAAENGHRDVVVLLLSKGAEVGAIDDDGKTALHWAAVGHSSWYSVDHKGVVELLLSKGLDICAADGKGRTALHLAAKHGCNGLVALLLSKGAHIGALDKDGRTA